MTLPRTTRQSRVFVSSFVALLSTAALDACATGGAGAREAFDDRAPAPTARVGVRFDNASRERVHVYLVSETRDWYLGPVEPGAHVWLTLPRRAMAGSGRPVRLAAIAGGRLTQQASSDPRAVVSLGQPTGELLEQRWIFAQGQLWPMRLRR